MPDRPNPDLRITEVAPRDGLQNEAAFVPTDAKLRLVAALAASGLDRIEAGSFVSPKWVPALADTADLWPRLPAGPLYLALVPNARGLETARAAGANAIAVFTAASETFNLRNVNMGVREHLALLTPLVAEAKADGLYVRGYVSTIAHCPYDGPVPPASVERVARALLDAGCDEISLGETTGRAVPRDLAPLLDAFAGVPNLWWHFHDTWGAALANVAACLERGYRDFDASAAGLGGCPYAKGAGGNLATEDLASFAEREGLTTGVDLPGLARATNEVLGILGHPADSKVRRALLADA